MLILIRKRQLFGPHRKRQPHILLILIRKRQLLGPLNSADPDKKKSAVRASYHADPDKKKAVVRASYSADIVKKKAASRALYNLHPLKKHLADRAAYRDNADRRKVGAKARYDANPAKKCAATQAAYKADPEKMKALFREYHASHHSTRLRYFRKYHCYAKRERVKKARYSLPQPINQLAIERCYKSVKANLLADGEALLKLKQEFKSLRAGVADTLSKAEFEQTVGRLAVKRLVCKTLQICRKHTQGFCWVALNSSSLLHLLTLEKAATLV